VSEEAETANINAYNLNAFGRKDAAVKAFKDAIAKYPNYEWPYGNLAAIYIEDGKYEDAVVLLKKVLAINPNYFNGWNHLADAYRGLGDEDEVKRCQQRALEILPKQYQDVGY
jgi:tetratricopeptide (TPR) repeat protein